MGGTGHDARCRAHEFLHQPGQFLSAGVQYTVWGDVDDGAFTDGDIYYNLGSEFDLGEALAEAAASGIYCRMRIYQDDGTMLGTANGGATCELNTVALPVSGTYTVLALDYYGSGTGDYLLHAQCTNDPVGATSLTYNQTYAADWALRAETDAYTFSGSDGDRWSAPGTRIGTRSGICNLESFEPTRKPWP